MAYVLQVDFKMNGPFGDEMAEAFSDLAKSINEEEGFMWKIWTERPETSEAGGIYIFETKETLKNIWICTQKDWLDLELLRSTQKCLPSILNLQKSRMVQ